MTTAEKRYTFLKILQGDWLANQVAPIKGFLDMDAEDFGKDIEYSEEYTIKNFRDIYKNGGEKQTSLQSMFDLVSIEDLYEEGTKDLFDLAEKLSKEFQEILDTAKKEHQTLGEVFTNMSALLETAAKRIDEMRAEVNAELAVEKGGEKKR